MTTPQDTTETLADYLATTVPSPSTDGTWSDVHEDTKLDRTEDADGNPLDPVDASGIATKNGAVFTNSVSAMWLASYQALHLAAKIWKRADATARDALGSDNDLAADDLLFKTDDATLWVCDSVDGAAASTWSAITVTGDVTGPGSSTDHAVARFDGAGGKTLQNSVVVISDAGAITGVASIAVSGNVDGRDVSVDGAALDSHLADNTNPHDVILAQTLVSDGGTGGAGDGITIEAGDFLSFEENAAVPATPGAGTAVLWLKDDGNMYVDTPAGSFLVAQDITTVDHTLARFDGTAGALQESNVVVDDSDNMTIPGDLTVGSATESAPTITLHKDTAGVANLRFDSESVLRDLIQLTSAEALAWTCYDSAGANGVEVLGHTENVAGSFVLSLHNGDLTIDGNGDIETSNELNVGGVFTIGGELTNPTVLLDMYAPATGGAVAGTTNDRAMFAFADVSNLYVLADMVLSKHYQGNGLILHMLWSQGNGTTGNVVWDVFVELVSDGMALGSDSFDTVTTATLAVPGTVDVSKISTIAIAASEMDGAGPGDRIRIKLLRERDSANDTFNSSTAEVYDLWADEAL